MNNSRRENEHDGSEDKDFIEYESPKDSNIQNLSSTPSCSTHNDSDYVATPSSTQKRVRRRNNTNLQKKTLGKPLKYGWVRELVYRKSKDSSIQRKADIYYYTPSGKKLRSLKEISKHLTGDLTLDNFSFRQKPIGIDDPAKEIIRKAHDKQGRRRYKLPVPRQDVLNINIQQPSTDGELVPGFQDQQVASSSTHPDNEDKEDEQNKKECLLKASADNFMSDINAGSVCLGHIFQYLNVYELMQVRYVSRTWNFIATQSLLWKTLKLENLRVTDWNRFTQVLKKHGTRNLDLRGMLLPTTDSELAQMWKDLCEAVRVNKTIVKVNMGRCSATAFNAIAEVAPQLKSLVSLEIEGGPIDLLPIAKNCRKLTELKVRAVNWEFGVKALFCLKHMKNLQHLALTTIRNLQGIENVLPNGLISLELGGCSQLTLEFVNLKLPQLVHLKRLRLEYGYDECPTLALLNTISELPLLTQLELINFEIRQGFDQSISRCSNLRTLLIIPTYSIHPEQTIHLLIDSVVTLRNTLKNLIWGLTEELLEMSRFSRAHACYRAPQIFLPHDEYGLPVPCIPVPRLPYREGHERSDFIELARLPRILKRLLPATKIQIFTVPFVATWRQRVTDYI